MILYEFFLWIIGTLAIIGLLLILRCTFNYLNEGQSEQDRFDYSLRLLQLVITVVGVIYGLNTFNNFVSQKQYETKQEVYRKAISVLNRYVLQTPLTTDKGLKYTPTPEKDTDYNCNPEHPVTYEEINNTYSELALVSPKHHIPADFYRIISTVKTDDKPLKMRDDLLKILRRDLGYGDIELSSTTAFLLDGRCVK